MKSKILLGAVILFSAILWGGIPLYWKWRWAIFSEGYHVGMTHSADYVKCSGWTRTPSEAWQDEAFHYVANNFRDCAIVEMVRRKSKEPPFTSGPWKNGEPMEPTQ